MADNKSGYALRTELLGMAIAVLESRNNREEQNETFLAENDRHYQRKVVKPYATDDVLEVAAKLQQFVENK